MAWNNIKTTAFKGNETRAQGLVVMVDESGANTVKLATTGTKKEKILGVVKEPNMKDGEVCGVATEGLCMFIANSTINKGKMLKVGAVAGTVEETSTEADAIGIAGMSAKKDELFEGYLKI